MRVYPPFTEARGRIETLQSQGTATVVPGSVVHRRYPQFTETPMGVSDLPFGSAAVISFVPAWAARANRLISGGVSS